MATATIRRVATMLRWAASVLDTLATLLEWRDGDADEDDGGEEE